MTTPRTDAAILTEPYEVRMLPCEVVPALFAGILEHELSEARRENAELHKAIREAYFLLAAFEGGAVDRLNWHNRRADSLARLQPFIDHSSPATSQETT